MPHGKPFVSYTAPLPPQVTRKTLRNQTRVVGVQQTVDLTPNTPLVQDKDVYWSKDEQNMVFDSNRADLPGTTAGTLSHIYRMNSDGTGVTALTGPLSTNGVRATTSQTEPAFNAGATTVVYIDTDPNGAVDLRELNLSSGIERSLVATNSQNLAFKGLNHPEYGFAIGGNAGVIFAGTTAVGQPFHLYSVDTTSGVITQLTSGAADDRNPTLNPDTNLPFIAFDSNRANPAGSATKANRDVWIMNINPAAPNPVQVTNFSAGGKASDNIQPAWSTNKVDQPTGTQHIVNGQQLIGFASTRFSASGGAATGVSANGTHDIYWLKTTFGVDSNGNLTLLTPENATSNPGYELPTSDPQHIYDDLHPTWPQFISSYRIAYDSDRTFVNAAASPPVSGPAGQPRDIFASTLIDLNAPTLVRFDTISGNVIDVQPRIAAPGSTVTFQVKVADNESGVRDVWLQIKNPNSKYQSSDGVEHRVYLTGFGTIPDNANVIAWPIEYESQRIYIGDGTGTGTPYTYANPKYIASVDDFFAFSGSANPPDQAWLQLQPVPGSRDADGVVTYKATWQTDVKPTDYYLDVIVYDNALNPFTTSAQDKANNWKIYDNVWGFTTQTFIPGAHNILFVSDYAAGQKFFNSRFNNATLTNVYNTFWGSESWMTDIDVDLLPTSYVPKSGGTGGTLVIVDNTLGPMSYGASESGDPFSSLQYDPSVIDGTVVQSGKGTVDVPATQQYDLWRILCRGALPPDVLQQYAPRPEQQPPDTQNGETAPRTVLNAQKCVIWHAPYTGDLFVGPGTLTDRSVQAQLHNFLLTGGRLFVNGQDIGFALTLDGTSANDFFTGDLRAQYIDDQVPGVGTIAQGGGFVPLIEWVSSANALTATGNPDPITFDPWRFPGQAFPISPPHIYPGPPFPPGYADNVSNEAEHLVAGVDGNDIWDTGSPGVVYADEIEPLANVTTDMKYGTGHTALQHYADSGTGQRVVYSPMGIEGMSPESFTPPNTTGIVALKNRRTEILHNIVCWLRTGTITGTVADTNGQLLANVLVRLYNRVDAKGNPIIAYTGLTRQDGTYAINGVESGQYAVLASKPGFTIQKRTGQSVHGGFRADMSFRLTKAEDAIITGKVTETDGTTPIQGATLTLTSNDPNNPITLTATTGLDGTYTIKNVPAGITYTLKASKSDHGASIPVSYPVPNPNDPIASQQDATVQPAKTYAGFNFQLKAIPGIVTGHVYALDANGNQVGPIANATVTATLGTQTVTAVTDANGAYSFNAANTPANGLDPGTWSFVATAPGFAPNAAISVVVISNQTVVAPDIKLSPVPPGAISGLVTRTSDNAPLGQVLIQVKDANGNLIASATTSDTATTDSTGYKFNYKIASVPAGVTYSVSASRSGYTPQQSPVSVAVTSGTESKNVNFAMDPLHTFPGALSLVSAPYDYSTNSANVAQLLSASPSDPMFLFATWNVGSYVFFPNPPADTFHLGRGYFLQYSTNLPLSTQGTAANATQPFTINLAPGWNMIGDPFLTDIDWTKAQFQLPGAGTPLTYDQAVAQGIIGAALYGYQSGTYALTFRLSPWLGYWARAYQSVTLILDPNTASIPSGRAAAAGGVQAGASADMSRAVLRGGDGWSLNVRVDVGDAHDGGNYLGVSSRAASGFDGYKVEKPPIVPNSRYAYLTFDHPDWGSHSGGYGVDVRPVGAKTTWDFSVQTNVADQNATITWPNAATVARGINLVVTDLDSGTTRSLQNSGSYSWNTGDKPATRHFRIEATRATVNSQLVITSVLAHSTGSRAATTSAIAYTLSQPANVEIRIVGAYGQTVRRLSAGTTRAAGANTATWDQRDERGMAVPSGIYTVEVKAQSLDGKSTARQVTPLIVAR